MDDLYIENQEDFYIENQEDFYTENQEDQRPLTPIVINCRFKNFFFPPSEQEQDVAAGAYPFANPFSKVAADDRGFHPSVFSPGVCEAMAEFAANSFDESQDLPGGTPGSASHSTFLRGKERPPGVLACPFEDCDFRHLVDYTQATLEESWKTHVYDVHWPTPTKNWKSCGWEGCGLALKNRSSAWNHLAVHIKHFHIRCPTEGCFTYFSRAHLASKHVRETHTGKRRS